MSKMSNAYVVTSPPTRYVIHMISSRGKVSIHGASKSYSNLRIFSNVIFEEQQKGAHGLEIESMQFDTDSLLQTFQYGVKALRPGQVPERYISRGRIEVIPFLRSQTMK